MEFEEEYSTTSSCKLVYSYVDVIPPDHKGQTISEELGKKLEQEVNTRNWNQTAVVLQVTLEVIS